jgi:hypothetical protein
MDDCEQTEAQSVSGNPVAETKYLRKELDKSLQFLKGLKRQSRERSLTVTKIQEAIMWLGMDLKDLNEPNPYPKSYDPSSPRIEPTADGLKL